MNLKWHQKKAFQKSVEEPLVETKKYNYILYQEKMDMEYGIAEEDVVFQEHTVQEMTRESVDNIHYKYGRLMKVIAHSGSGKRTYYCMGMSLSNEGMIVKVHTEDVAEELDACSSIELQMKLVSSDMPDDLNVNLKVGASLENVIYTDEGELYCAFLFLHPLSYYDNQKRSGFMFSTAIAYFAAALFCFLLLASESIWCLRYDGLLYKYSILVFVFAGVRYLLSALYKIVPSDNDFVPNVTIVIPNLSNGTNISRTVASCREQRYPKENLDIMIMNGCNTGEEALEQAVSSAKGDYIVVASDGCELHTEAVREIVQPFQDSNMAAVCGSPRVRNRYYNLITKILAIQHFHEFRVVKARESCFDAVAKIDGSLCCYKKEVIQNKQEIDKSRTGYQDSAVVFLNVESTKSAFWKHQKEHLQIDWKQFMHGWKNAIHKEPFVLIFCYMNKLIYLVFPFILIYGLVVVPVKYQVVPIFYIGAMVVLFLFGLFMQVRIVGLQLRKPRDGRRAL